MQQLVRHRKLAEEIDARLRLFKVHLPNHESDQVLNLAYNALCAGTGLEDLELRRQDEAYLYLLGTDRIPAQAVKTGRRIMVRLLAYNHWQPVFIRLSETFAHPHRC